MQRAVCVLSGLALLVPLGCEEKHKKVSTHREAAPEVVVIEQQPRTVVIERRPEVVVVQAPPPPTQVVYVQEPPPPIRVEPVPPCPSPTFVWINGCWNWGGRGYVWVPGRWCAPPHRGSIWVGASWQRGSHGWYASGGHWR